MPTPVTWASGRQFVGVAKEAVQGTALAPTNTMPMSKFDPEDKPTWLTDDGMRGSMVDSYGEVQGVIRSEIDMGGPVFPDTCGFVLNNILGDITTTGASAPFSHAMAVLNSGQGQPGSLCFTDWQGPTATVFARVWPGCCLSEVTITWNAETALLAWTGKATGYPSAVAGAAPTSAPTTIGPQPSWRMLVGLGGPASGGTLVAYATDGEVSIKRKAVNPYYTANGVQAPYIMQRDTVDVTGKVNFISPDEVVLNYMLNNTQPQMQWLLTQGAGAALVSFQLDTQVTAFKVTKIDRSKEAVMYSTEFRGVANSTNAGASGGFSPAKVTLKNALPSGSY